MQPLVSVVLPTYNRPDRLRRSLESVRSQTYDRLELIVVDDASETDTEAVIDNLDRKAFESVSYIKHEENRGGNAARATGIRNATGEYVAFLDDDDGWVPTKVERQVTTFREADEPLGLVYTGTKNENIDRVDLPDIRGDVGQEILLRNFVGTFSSVMVPAEVVEAVGLPDERFPCDQDWEWYVRIGQRWPFDYVAEPLVDRGGGTNEYEQVSGDVYAKAETAPLFIKKYEENAASYGQWFARKWRAAVLFRVSYIAFMKDEYRLSRRFGFRAIRHNPFVWRYYVTLLLTVVDRPAKAVYNRLPLRTRRKIGQVIRTGNR